MLQDLPITSALHHVKGHQHDMYAKGYQGPLSQDVYWNLQMDALAVKKRLSTPTPAQTIFALSDIAPVTSNGVLTTDMGPHLKEKFLAPALVLYICEKEEWSQDTFHLVDWQGLECFLAKMSIY